MSQTTVKTELELGVYHCINYSCCYSEKKYRTKFQNENLFFLQFEGTKFKQNHEVVGYIVSTVESRVTCWLFVFPFYSPRMVLRTFRVGLSSSAKPL